ncbi:MAG: hypothetical protein J5I93_22200 [Pirellulaceae bacterium]|nr:hypothetical protein [Pirellulaceae bacterium]
MAKRPDDDYEFEDPYDEVADDDFDDELDEDESDEPDDQEEVDEAEDEAVAEAEPEEILEPDHPDTLSALRDIGARLDIDDRGHVWRVFFYERNNDEQLSQLHGLAALKEIWVVGSRVTAKGIEQIKASFPKVRVYS